MKILRILAFLVTILACVSCDTSTEYIEIEGTVRYIDLEGGFWGITVDDGRKFDPLNLPEKFKKDGLRVNVKLRPRDEMAGLHMWGQIVEIIQIEEIKKQL